MDNPMYLSSSLGAENDRTIFHYTDATGLIGILETWSIWASSIIFLNDAAEFHHTSSAIRDYVASNKNGDKEKLLIDLATNVSFGMTQSLGSFTTSLLHTNVFVASFSSKCDDLNQWRAYASKNGYCIGFKPSMLKNSAEHQGFVLKQVRYTKEEKDRLIQPVVDRYLSDCQWLNTTIDQLKLLKGVWPWTQHRELTEFTERFRDEAWLIAPLLKHSSFEAEEEWRLVSKRGGIDNMQFRSTENGLVPYTSIQLSTDEEKQLEIPILISGPSPRKSLNHIASMYAASRYKVKVESNVTSGTPYRNW